MTADPHDAPLDRRPLLFALHFLGGNAAAWSEVALRLAPRCDFVALDLPGFGDARDATGFAVSAMAAFVAAEIRARAPRRYVLVGHSMGAAVAFAVARMAESGAPGLDGLAGMALFSGSPPAPEPMNEAKRCEMLGWFAGDAATSRTEAGRYIDENIATSLDLSVRARTTAGVLQMNRGAWTAWLTTGSRENWALRIGVLQTPALIVAGEHDPALGIDAQVRLTAPHFSCFRLCIIPGVKHLAPLEAPDAVAALIGDLLEKTAPVEPAIPAAFHALMCTPRVSARTRDVLLERAEPVRDRDLLAAAPLATLRAMVDRIVPQNGPERIDLAARLTAAIASGPDDGWRFADMPTDGVALAAGLHALDALARPSAGRGFFALDACEQDRMLAKAAAGALTPPAPGLNAAQMKLWFEDVRSAAVRAYIAHPATHARIGYDGIANRGDGVSPDGFAAVGLGERETWETDAVLGVSP